MNDFVSKADMVNFVTTTVSSVTSASIIVLSAPSAADAAYLLLRGTDGVLYRYAISAGAGTATITVASTSGTFFDPEQNKQVSRQALNTSGLFTAGQAAYAAERIDGSSIYCGCWGEYKGIVGFTSANNAGLKLEYVGPRENENAYQYRLKWYCGFDLYNRLSLARIKSCLPLGA